jgi:arylsulfatase A-like enzyme
MVAREPLDYVAAMSSPPNIIVIAVDRLGAGWLGPYGNAWIPTPALNRLAAESLLCEFMVSDSCDLGAAYRSYFSGIPAWRTVDSTQPALAQLARAAYYETLLITDAEEIARHPLAIGFEHTDLLTWKRQAKTALAVNQTRLADVFTTAAGALANSDKPKFLWIHAAAMNAAWDAPQELRERVAAEDDPKPQSFVAPPSIELPTGYDPDVTLGVVQAYAAEIMAFDENLGTLLAALDAVCDPANTLLILTSPRGYALGEHLRVGLAGDALRGELLQVPLLVRYPDRATTRLTRLGGLHQPIDLHSLIAGAIQSQQITSLESFIHEIVPASASDEISLRTAHWFYRQNGVGENCVKELYAKPDDRWEVNEVSQRAADVVSAFDELAQWLQANRGLPDSPALPALPQILAAARR